jgi:hypothetical protein
VTHLIGDKVELAFGRVARDPERVGLELDAECLKACIWVRDVKWTEEEPKESIVIFRRVGPVRREHWRRRGTANLPTVFRNTEKRDHVICDNAYDVLEENHDIVNVTLAEY